MSLTIAQLQELTIQTRRDILHMVHAVNSGHPVGSLGCAEFFVALYHKLMDRKEGFDMDGIGEDIFFLSNGHISPVFYSVLARCGYFPVSELGTFRKLNSRLQGHPATHEGLPGVRIASGSLGQGLSVASGMALAKKMNQDSSFVFALTGDGELQEGQNWEAIMFAAHHKLDNLIVAVDYNGQQIDGPTHMVLHLGDLKSKFEAFGWEVQTIEKGNDMESVVKGIQAAKAASGNGKPICILLKTEMGAGVSFMEGTHKWHGIAPNDEQLAQALSELPETLGDY